MVVSASGVITMAFLALVVAAVIFGFDVTSECVWGSLLIEEASVIG